MQEKRIKEILNLVARNLLSTSKTQNFTPETRQSEWNLTHHFARKISLFFPSYDCEVDVIKPRTGNKRPDIIIHKKKTHKKNLLVIELKREVTAIMIKKELKRIRKYWFSRPFCYKFGAVVGLGRNYKIEVIKNL